MGFCSKEALEKTINTMEFELYKAKRERFTLPPFWRVSTDEFLDSQIEGYEKKLEMYKQQLSVIGLADGAYIEND